MNVEDEEADEKALWDEARAGAAQAFGRIFDLHKNRVFRHALRLCDSVSDAEDVVAIVFMELWRRRNDVRVVNGSVIAWLLVTATHCTRNFKRSSRRYQALLNRLTRSEQSQDAAEHYLHGSLDGLDARLALELRSLGWADQQLLSLVALEGFTMAETAEVLGISLSAVKSRLHRLRQRLQPRLSPRMNEATT